MFICPHFLYEFIRYDSRIRLWAYSKDRGQFTVGHQPLTNKIIAMIFSVASAFTQL